jgi:hypothetical protein
VWPLTRAEAPPPKTAAELAYESLPARPAGDEERGRVGVETSAVDQAAWLRAVPDAEGSDTPCPTERLRVSWTAPTTAYSSGAFISPLGPIPTETTTAVNGIVVCEGSSAGIMGFQARYADGEWDVQPVPDADEGEGDEHTPPAAPTQPEPTTPTPAPSVTLDGRAFGGAIEGLAAYEPQRTCDGTAKPGTLALRNLLLKDSPGTRNLGIVRGCSIGGRSEHKEGRAFDWGVSALRTVEKADADAFVTKVLATDEHGNRFALARRMGVMYMIWNQRIWSAYRAADGWRPYHGASPHKDHVHLSLSWAGAQGRTSFWSGNVVAVLLASAPTGTGGTRSVAAATPARSSSANRRIQRISTTRQAEAAARRAEWQKRKAEWETAHAEREKERDEERESARDERRKRWEEWAATTTTTTTTVPDPSATTSTTEARRRWRWRDAPSTTTTTTTITVVPEATTSTTAPDSTSGSASRIVSRWRRSRPTTTTVPPTTTTTTMGPTTTTTALTTQEAAPATSSTTTISTRRRRSWAPRPATTTTTTSTPMTTSTTEAAAAAPSTTTAGPAVVADGGTTTTTSPRQPRWRRRR